MLSRRSLLRAVSGTAFVAATGSFPAEPLRATPTIGPAHNEDIFEYVRRLRGRHDQQLFAQILGAANPFKEGDEIVGVVAADDASRRGARALLENTSLLNIDATPLHTDRLFRFITAARHPRRQTSLANWTLAEFKRFLLNSDQSAIQQVMPSLSSDVIACVVKLMSNDDLIQISQKIFNPLPGSQIGAQGYLGARIQPNSPTDNPDDIRWQVFDGFAYAVGDVLLGTNPVSSDPSSVAAIERTLQDLLVTFEIDHLLPHCVLAHIDIQSEVEAKWPGTTELWFQSIAGSDSASETFDISVEKMRQYARSRDGRFGLYFETGQGADFTNGHSHGFDMVMHESRKYGLARALAQQVGLAQAAAGKTVAPWVHLNDVAGFIGPEVFRSREQLVRCCLEDIVMGKLHGLCIGLDVCSTLHMDISLDDLDWCLDQVMPANPAYLMALPTKIDPMLGYLTTGYQDHVRLREKFGYRLNDGMWRFFQSLGVIDRQGQPTKQFGDPLWVYLQYRRRKGDVRLDASILAEGRQQLGEVRDRGLFVSEGHGNKPWDLQSDLMADIHRIYDDAKLSIWAEFDQQFIEHVPNRMPVATKSSSRSDYILHPTTGEQLNEKSVARMRELRRQQLGRFDVQVVVSDGLNALALMEEGHLTPFLTSVRNQLEEQGLMVSPDNLVVTSGRVRVGYRIGEVLFANLGGPRAILHVIGERPGTGHRTFSTYITSPAGEAWAAGTVDHNITKVVSGIATTALHPLRGAEQVTRLLIAMMNSTE